MRKALAVLLSVAIPTPSFGGAVAPSAFGDRIAAAEAEVRQSAAATREAAVSANAAAAQGSGRGAAVTGRSQILLIPDSIMDQMGEEAWREVLTQYKTSTDKEKSAMVQAMAEKIIRAAGQDPKRWDVRLFDTDEVNAFALPGRKIGVFKGILEVAQTEDALAAVMGHEVTHVINRHGNERITEQILAQVGISLASILSGAWFKDQQARNMIYQALGLFVITGVILPHSRTHEAEADAVGLLLMAEGGYDPQEAPKLWQRMTEKSGDYHDFLKTHPSHSKRIEGLNRLLPIAQDVRAGKMRAMTVRLDLGTRDDGERKMRTLGPLGEKNGYPNVGFNVLTRLGDSQGGAAGVEFDFPTTLIKGVKGSSWNGHLMGLESRGGETRRFAGGGIGAGVKQRIGRAGYGTPTGRTGYFLEPYLGLDATLLFGDGFVGERFAIAAQPRVGLALDVGDKYALGVEYRHAINVLRAQLGYHYVGVAFTFLQGKFKDLF